MKDSTNIGTCTYRCFETLSPFKLKWGKDKREHKKLPIKKELTYTDVWKEIIFVTMKLMFTILNILYGNKEALTQNIKDKMSRITT